MLRLYTFGGLQIERDNQPLQLTTQKARDLLAYLIVFRDRLHPCAQRLFLVAIEWGAVLSNLTCTAVTANEKRGQPFALSVAPDWAPGHMPRNYYGSSGSVT
jgi:hypothetical protein